MKISTAREIAVMDAFVNNINERINSLKDLDFIPLGSDYISGSSEVPRSLALHRLTKKFSLDEVSNEQLLTEKCMQQWIDFENNHLEFIDLYDRFQLAGQSRAILYRARMRLHSWCESFKLGKDINLPSGETYKTLNGRLGVNNRLRQLKTWTCSYDAADDFTRLVYDSLYLKRCAKKLFKPLKHAEHQVLYNLYKSEPNIGFAMFKHRFESDVVTYVTASRASSVYKDATKRRFINIEPFGNVILQRKVATGLLHILTSLGNDIETGQLDHQRLIANANVATIDFSNASDSIAMQIVEFMFPRKVLHYLKKYRSTHVLIDGVEYKSRKISSMGNGFTFEVMTMLLLAIARELDPNARVYGDDVIICNTQAGRFMDICKAIGFIPNMEKSFVSSRFRESCGSYYLDGYGYITSYDFKRASDIYDATILMNKLYMIKNHDPILEETYTTLLKEAPVSLLGTPPYDQSNLDGYIWCDFANLVKRKKRSVFERNRKAQLMKSTRVAFDAIQLSNNFSCFIKVKRKQRILSRSPIDDVRNVFWIASYMYSLRVTDDFIRGETDLRFNTWIDHHDTGLQYEIKSLT